MQVKADTKISAIIKANKASIEAIARLAPPFATLRNPILRKLLAPRVTLAEAAKIGACKPEDIMQALLPLGFTFTAEAADEPFTEDFTLPDWLQTASKQSIQYFDVRPMLAGGKDPLKEIMLRFKQLPESQILCIVNSFVPTPLLNLLGKKKALTYSKEEQPGIHYSYFYKAPSSMQQAATTSGPSTEPAMLDESAFTKLVAEWPKHQLTEIDVRALPMPQPMQTILQELNRLPKQHALLVHHKRVPIYLLQELASKNYLI